MVVRFSYANNNSDQIYKDETFGMNKMACMLFPTKSICLVQEGLAKPPTSFSFLGHKIYHNNSSTLNVNDTEQHNLIPKLHESRSSARFHDNKSINHDIFIPLSFHFSQVTPETFHVTSQKEFFLSHFPCKNH